MLLFTYHIRLTTEMTTQEEYLTYYGKDKSKWDWHKDSSEKISFFYATSINENHRKYNERMSKCAEILRFIHVGNNPDIGDIEFKLAHAQFCRVRLCPICQWRRSMAWRARFFQNLPELLSRHKNLSFIFLTLTVKNCEIHNLSENLKWMNSAWNKMRIRKEFKVAIKGFIRSTEVTKSGNLAHPHFHTILAVNKRYLSKGEKYISQSKWVEMWQSCLGVDYLPVVDVRKLRSNGFEIESRAIIETLKYTTKVGDLLDDKEWFLELTDQLFRKRFISTGGVFKNILKEDVDNNEMLLLDDETSLMEREDMENQYKSSLFFAFDRYARKYRKIKNPYTG
ncbi:Replication protein [Haemophilus haemolyticus]|uniref:Replication protein n=2 Tax=Haemophilus haemolyticus TaxID=726 RepID=A0A502LJ60_HAEHA|nr:Replication protein [Haemophilus haemolyticus]